MPIAQRLALATVLLTIVLGVAALGAFASIDRLLADARFRLLNRPPSGQVVFVEIDSASLDQIGVWPWPREVHANILDRLMRLGATRVAFDIDFSSRSTPFSDAAFARSLNAAGGHAFLAAFEQVDGATGEHRLTTPIAEFTAHAAPVAVDMQTDDDGLVEGMPSATLGLPALPVAITDHAAPPVIHIDYGINLGAIDRIPVRDVLDDRVDPARIAGRQVVVGASAVELRDIVSVPRFGIVPGPLAQIAGAETLHADGGLRPLGPWPGTIAAFLFALIWVVIGQRIAMRHAIASTIGAIVGALLLSLALQAWFGITMNLGGFVMAMLVLLGLHIALGFAREFARRRQAEAQLVYLARHDSVTGLPSRLGFLEQLDSEPPGPIVLVALRRLELVRGSLGREIADAALGQAAGRLGALAGSQLAMIDNDTFAISLPPETTDDDIDDLARELRRSLRPEFEAEGHEVHVDAVLAAAPPDPLASSRLQLQRAELALEAAIASPASTVVWFTPAMEDAVARRRHLDAALRQAIERRELGVVFQPQVETGTGQMVGVEALVRWTSPDLGPIPPSEFIPLAEESGLIVPLGRLVLTEACRVAAGWPWKGWLAVNVSAAQLALSDIADTVADALHETGFEPQRLNLEITESVLVDHPERTLATFARLKALGVGIALDDFGTGYSSLNYLSQLPFDKLKIDQSFVRRLGESEAEDAIVHAMVGLARRLGKTTIAEGVETEAQRSALAEMGCGICQGWLVGKPAPADEIARRIATMRAA